jgi:hypothetical protein
MGSSRHLLRCSLPETFSEEEVDFLERFFALDALPGRPRELLALALEEAISLGKGAELYFNIHNVYVDGERGVVVVQSDLAVDGPDEVRLSVADARRVLETLRFA